MLDFFLDRKIAIGIRENNFVVYCAVAVDNAALYVNDYFSDEEKLKEQMARFEALSPEKRDKIFGDPKRSE